MEKNSLLKTPVIDLACCVLCELCIDLAPRVFQLNDAGFVEVAILDDYSDDEIQVQEAVNNCPKGCIIFE